VILDCDGVLFESARANIGFYDAVLAAVGMPPLDEEGRRLCHTLAGTQLFPRLAGGDTLVQQRLSDAARSLDYGPFYALMEPAPLLVPTLRRLAAHCPLALATNRGRTAAEVLVRFDIARFFTACVGVLDVARPKPAPDLLLACLERTHVPAAAAVYVGDTELDRAAAAAAGIGYVGVGRTSGGDPTIAGLQDLPALLLD
jgi:phosphoglycolate phosphatase-like HAD superfamily hydrolase